MEREGKKEDDKDRVLDKLRSINYRLRKKLKELNAKVERAIDRTDTKRVLAARNKKEIDLPHRIRVKDRELENSEQQLQAYKKEIEALRNKVDELNQVDKMLDMEQEVKDNRANCSDLKKQIKELEKMSKDKGKALERLTEGDDYNYKIRNMIDEIRMWKEKIRHRQELYDKNENTVGLQSERMGDLEKENQKLMQQIQALDSNLKLDPTKTKDPKVDKEIEKINKEKQAAKEDFEAKQKANRKEIKQVEKEIQNLEAKRDALFTRAKELDQEQRISSLKLREVGRILKHNQLKPISPVRASGTLTSKNGDMKASNGMSKRGSTTNLIATKNTTLASARNTEKKMSKGKNTQSTQLLNKKEYSKRKGEESDEELEKNQVIDYEKFKQQQKNRNSNLSNIKSNKGNKGTFETKTVLK